ncbi:MAG: hypothetical protein GEU99_03575 [Luteitalea sp.]|nr:hypothetical protein [Luteitalea sp.]
MKVGSARGRPFGVVLVLLVVVVASCKRTPATGIDQHVTNLGSIEVTARLLEIPGEFPSNELYNYAFILKYRVLVVHRGEIKEEDILVGQYNPRKPRSDAEDDFSGTVGGDLTRFRAGDVHRLALAAPLDEYWMGGIIDKYFDQKGVRYWAFWTNRVDK